MPIPQRIRRTIALPLCLSAAMMTPVVTAVAQTPAVPVKSAARPVAAKTAMANSVTYVRVNGADYSFSSADQVAAGVVAFELVNTGPDLHAMAVLELPDNHTLREFLDMYHGKGAIAPWMTMLGQTQPIAATQSAFLTVRLKPGRYILACLIPARDGRAHSEKGMVKLITAR